MRGLQDLRHRVVLLKRRVTEGADGSFTELWEAGDAVWACVVPHLGREALGEEWNVLTPVQAKYKVTVRFRKERFARIKWEDMTLALLSPPLADSRRQWISCLMYAMGENDERRE